MEMWGEVRVSWCRGLSRFQYERPNNKWLNKITSKRQAKRGIDSNILHLLRCWALHAALNSAPVDLPMAQILSGGRNSPFQSFEVIFNFLTKNSSVRRASPCRRYHVSAEQELPAGSCPHRPMLVAVYSQDQYIPSLDPHTVPLSQIDVVIYKSY